MTRPSNSERGRSPRRRPHIAALLALVCSAILVIPIAAATARPDHSRRSSDTSTPASSETTPASSEQAPAQGGGGTSATTETTAPGKPARAERHSRHGATGTAQNGSSASPESSSTVTPEAQHGGAGPHHQGAGHDGQGSQHAQRERGSAKQGHGPSAVSPATSTAQSGSEAESPTEARRKHERAAKPTTSHVARGKAKEVESARPTKLTSEPASSPFTSSAPESVSPGSLST
ncbi:MAG TPA: hypothetical protein VHT29_04185, partial [Solirubrobacteraceae bacterium]|nr:hypothetical protein [Solirubrobacteraceae bacterium]